MSKNQNIIKDFVGIWRNSPMATVPIFPPEKIVPNTNYPQATITCSAGTKEFNSGFSFICDYIVEIIVYDNVSRRNHTTYQGYMELMYNFNQFLMLASTPLIVLPEPENLIEEDENTTSGISKSINRWIVRCQQ